LYTDTVPLSDLPKHSELRHKILVVDLAAATTELDSHSQLHFSEIRQEPSQRNALQSPVEQSSAEFSILQLLQAFPTDTQKR